MMISYNIAYVQGYKEAVNIFEKNDRAIVAIREVPEEKFKELQDKFFGYCGWQPKKGTAIFWKIELLYGYVNGRTVCLTSQNHGMIFAKFVPSKKKVETVEKTTLFFMKSKLKMVVQEGGLRPSRRGNALSSEFSIKAAEPQRESQQPVVIAMASLGPFHSPKKPIALNHVSARRQLPAAPAVVAASSSSGTINLPADGEKVVPGENVEIPVKLMAPVADEQGVRLATPATLSPVEAVAPTPPSADVRAPTTLTPVAPSAPTPPPADRTPTPAPTTITPPPVVPTPPPKPKNSIGNWLLQQLQSFASFLGRFFLRCKQLI